ncbi:RecX family transcriptional regulator [Myxococcota bacterium]|nr:RecX family transcriptional regulator [Myxococcota bacterium]MBU1432075.1 RecX family transcriptional regulator [Myxococcota bacterium]MBU1897783.1 RecX family transcriptional regulator [Myxococcota bacterium]
MSPKRALKPKRVYAIALAHVQRYPCSVQHLRAVMARKFQRSLAAFEGDRAALDAALEEAITQLSEAGWLNDAALALAITRSLHGRGKSRRYIANKLSEKGLAEHRAVALEALGEEVDDPDQVAALAFARKRRLGPWRRGEGGPDVLRRELGKMARAGFSFDLARRVLSTPLDEDEDQADGGR